MEHTETKSDVPYGLKEIDEKHRPLCQRLKFLMGAYIVLRAAYTILETIVIIQAQQPLTPLITMLVSFVAALAFLNLIYKGVRSFAILMIVGGLWDLFQVWELIGMGVYTLPVPVLLPIATTLCAVISFWMIGTMVYILFSKEHKAYASERLEYQKQINQIKQMQSKNGPK